MIKKMKHRKPIPYERKKALFGYGFISLWLFGTIFYFIRPLIDVFRYSFSSIERTDIGYELDFVGFEIYYKVLRIDPDFIKQFTSAMSDLAYQVPVIMAFSFIIAIVLNQRFRGRLLMRALFFIPVIVASGVVINILNGDSMAQMIISGSKNSAMFQVSSFANYLYQLGLPQQIINPVISAANNVFNLTWKSGIQILILIAGLQTIPNSLYEVAAIDGASGWEKFWKITFPLVSPMLILVFIYSIIDSFTDYNNGLMRTILQKNSDGKTELAAAMAILYFLCIALVIGIVYRIVNKHVYYANAKD